MMQPIKVIATMKQRRYFMIFHQQAWCWAAFVLIAGIFTYFHQHERPQMTPKKRAYCGNSIQAASDRTYAAANRVNNYPGKPRAGNPKVDMSTRSCSKQFLDQACCHKTGEVRPTGMHKETMIQTDFNLWLVNSNILNCFPDKSGIYRSTAWEHHQQSGYQVGLVGGFAAHCLCSCLHLEPSNF